MTTALDLAGIACLSAFVFFVWPPLPLLVVGVVALLISRRLSS